MAYIIMDITMKKLVQLALVFLFFVASYPCFNVFGRVSGVSTWRSIHGGEFSSQDNSPSTRKLEENCLSDDSEFDSYLSFGSDFEFYWSIENDIMRCKCRWPGSGWGGWGVNTDSRMIGADAIVAVPSTSAIRRSKLSSYSVSGIDDYTEQNIFNASVAFDSDSDSDEVYTVLKFSRPLAVSDSDEVAIDSNGANIFIWAYDSSTTLDSFHSNYGKVTVTLSPSNCTASQDDQNLLSSSQYILAHGIVMALCWGLIIPLGSVLPTFNKTRLHKVAQQVGALITVVGLALAISYTESKNKGHFSSNTHSMVGLVMLLLVFLQVVVALCRPAPPDINGNVGPSKKRKLWEQAHKIFGVCLVLLGLFMIISGFSAAHAPSSFVMFAVCWSLLVLITYAVIKFKYGKKAGSVDGGNRGMDAPEVQLSAASAGSKIAAEGEKHIYQP